VPVFALVRSGVRRLCLPLWFSSWLECAANFLSARDVGIGPQSHWNGADGFKRWNWKGAARNVALEHTQGDTDLLSRLSRGVRFHV
jgi:hypothetical protein